MNTKDKIDFLINSCKKNSEIFPHTLLITEDYSIVKHFANNIARSMNTNVVFADAESISSPGDLAEILTNLKAGDLLLMNNINLINKECLQYIIPTIEDFVLDLMVDSGTAVRSVQVKLNFFTLIATAPKLKSVNKRLMGSFFCKIEGEDIQNIAEQSIIKILHDLKIIVTN